MSSVASPAGLIHLGMDTSKNTIVVATLLPNIAAANRHHARDPQRTLKLLQTT